MDTIIGNEVMFGFNKNIADILQLANNKIYAFEIKGDNDDFRRLPKQIGLYKSVFDYLYIVTTIKHISQCNYLDKDIGIILITNNGEIKIIKNARLQKHCSKEEIIETINASFLKKYFEISGNKTSTQIRNSIEKKSKKVMKDVLYSYLNTILQPKFKIFMNERGESTHVDDLSLLSLFNRIII